MFSLKRINAVARGEIVDLTDFAIEVINDQFDERVVCKGHDGAVEVVPQDATKIQRENLQDIADEFHALVAVDVDGLIRMWLAAKKEYEEGAFIEVEERREVALRFQDMSRQAYLWQPDGELPLFIRKTILTELDIAAAENQPQSDLMKPREPFPPIDVWYYREIALMEDEYQRAHRDLREAEAAYNDRQLMIEALVASLPDTSANI